MSGPAPPPPHPRHNPPPPPAPPSRRRRIRRSAHPPARHSIGSRPLQPRLLMHMALAGVDALHYLRVDVAADHTAALPHILNRQRQTDLAQAHHRDHTILL